VKLSTIAAAIRPRYASEYGLVCQSEKNCGSGPFAVPTRCGKKFVRPVGGRAPTLESR
jgi:hypothetical protein